MVEQPAKHSFNTLCKVISRIEMVITSSIIDVGEVVDRTPSERAQLVLSYLTTTPNARFKNLVELVGCISTPIGQIVETFPVGCEFIFLAFHNQDLVFIRTDDEQYHRIVWYANELDTAESKKAKQKTITFFRKSRLYKCRSKFLDIISTYY